MSDPSLPGIHPRNAWPWPYLAARIQRFEHRSEAKHLDLIEMAKQSGAGNSDQKSQSTAISIIESVFDQFAHAARANRQARLLGALAGVKQRSRSAFGKVLAACLRELLKRDLSGTIEFRVNASEAGRFVEAEVRSGGIVNRKSTSATSGVDLESTRAKLEILGSRLSQFRVENWNSVAPSIVLRQTLPRTFSLPTPNESAQWRNLLEANTVEDAVVLAQQRARDLKLELAHAQAHDAPAAPAVTGGNRDDLETLSVVVSRASNAILIMDSDGMIQWVNAAFTKLTGYTLNEVLLHRLDELLFGPNTNPDTLFEIGEALRHGYELTSDLLQYHHDGRTCWVECKLVPVHDQQGRLVRWVALERDITRRRQTEEALRAAKQAAEESSRAKSEFLANMSHEIRTPLNAILGMTELCLATSLDKEQREYLRAAHASADTLLQLLNDVLDLSKIEAGKMEIEERDFNLADVVRETVKALSVRAHEKGIEVVVRMSMDLPQQLRGDAVRLRQVLFNLIGNAIKFTESGEVVIEVEEQWSGEDEVGVHVAIRDTGIGIPADRLERIFQSFTQVDSSVARRFGGSGLGLAITSQLLKLMNGRIWVRSEEGRGSTFHFTVRLERSDAASLDPGILAAASASELAGRNALIVDDNLTNRRVLEGMLRQGGMRAVSVSDAASVIRMLELTAKHNESFDVLLVDYAMPECDGFQLVEQIRLREDLDVGSILMLSSLDRAEHAGRCRALGIGGYMLKPISNAELLKQLCDLLGGRQVRLQHGRELVSPNTAWSKTSPSKKSLRVLVADDHDTNRNLVAEILRRRGHRCVAVTDGAEAVEAYLSDDFDVILMDVQMPNVDGLMATRQIRELQNEGRATPIIALTAHAMAGDRERFLAAGMDDYLAKPIHAARLIQLVETTANQPPPEQPAGRDQPQLDPPPVPKSVNDAEDHKHAEFDFDAALARMGGESDLLFDHMNYVLSDSPKLVTEIYAAIENQQPRSLQIASHRLKSLVSAYNCTRARDLASELERMGELRAFADAATVLARLHPLVKQLREAISNYLTNVKAKGDDQDASARRDA